MAENPEEEAVEAEAPPKKAGMILPLLLAVLASGAGGVVGMTLLGPPAGAWMAARASEGGGEKKGGGHGGGHGGGVETIHILDNLVVNPAGSEGTRYLLISVALEPVDPEMVEELAARDVALRDALLSFLGARTVDELADITKREDLVKEMKVALEHEVGQDVIYRIYLPQYVIQ